MFHTSVYVENKYEYQVLNEEANKYDHFQIDASEFPHTIWIALSRTGRHSDEKWEIIIGGLGGTKSVIRPDGLDHLVKDHSVADFNNIKGNIEVLVVDGALIIKGDGQTFMQYDDNSIKKNELKYLMVSGGWVPGAFGTYRVWGFKNEGEFIFADLIIQ